MGGESYPIRHGALGTGNPEQFDYQQIYQKIRATDSAGLHNLSRTYEALRKLLDQAKSDLAFHHGRLKAAWPEGPSSELALGQIKRLETAADELANASNTFGFALQEAGRQVDTFKQNTPAEPKGPFGVGPPPDPKHELMMEKYGKDREARQYMADMNQRLADTYSIVPTSINMDLPGQKRGVGFGETATGGGSLGGAPGSTGGGNGEAPNGGWPTPPGRIPDTSLPLSPSDPGDLPPGGVGGGGGVSDLEGVTPGALPPVPEGPGLSPPPPGTGGGQIGLGLPPGLGPGMTPFSPGVSGPARLGPVVPPSTGGSPRPILPTSGAPGVPGPGPIGQGPRGSGPMSGGSPPRGLRSGPPGSGPIGGGSSKTPGSQRPGSTPGVRARTPGSSGAGAGGVIGRESGTGAGRTGTGSRSASRSAAPGGTPASPGKGSRRRDRSDERETWLSEDEDIWSDDEGTAPPVIQ